MQPRTGRLAPLVLVGLTVAVAAAPAAVITVDVGCSLIDAILAANEEMPQGGCDAGDGADTIVLTTDVTLVAVANPFFGGNGLPPIESEIAIRGQGHRIARDTNPATPEFRLFYVGGDGRLTLQDLEITGGSASEAGSLTARGGAIFNKGFVRLERVELHGNEAEIFRSGATAVNAVGGGIYNEDVVEIVESSLYSNQAKAENSTTVGMAPAVAEGGAIHSGPLADTRILLSSLQDNLATSLGVVARSRGGAVYSESAIDLKQSSVLVNFARAEGTTEGLAFGGAIFLGGTDLDASSISGNYVEGNGALSVSPDGDAAGGGVYAANVVGLAIHASTFASNTVSPPAAAVLPSGGAVEARDSSKVDMTRVTLVGNGIVGHAGPFGGTTLHGGSTQEIGLFASIADRTTPGASDACAGNLTATLTGDNFGCLAGDPAVTGLATLAGSNGGPTPTLALDPASNAVDAVRLACSVHDQRGVSSIGGCDSGAYEVNPCVDDDVFEELPGDSTDDACPGQELEIGVAQSHLHCDPDWVWFTALADKTYEIRTFELINGADTALELRESGCGEVLATDDDSGQGRASRLLVTSPTNETFDVGITEALDSYNPGSSPPATVEGYDVQVLCIEKCGCAPPDGPNLLLENDSLDLALTYEACSTITALNWIVGPGGDAHLRAGEQVILVSGVVIEGSLRVEIDPALAPP